MASLMENLIETLEKENAEYEGLLELSMEKTGIIVQGDVERLQKITDEEQSVLDRIGRLEQTREEVLKDVADVLNKDVANLKLVDLIQVLEQRPQEQKRLAKIHDRLQDTIKRMTDVNGQNRELIRSALDMVEFDINLIQAAKAAPETANYNKGAYNAGSVMGNALGGFDAKQ